MFYINPQLSIPLRCITISAIRAQGAGGQNVNKVSSAICLQIDLSTTPMPDYVREKLYSLNDSRISANKVLTIKAQSFRTQLQNKEDALTRLASIIDSACHRPKKRLATKPTRGSVERRITQKNQRSGVKAMRKNVRLD